MINKFNLKLNDINKEIEYNQASISDIQIRSYVNLIWTCAFLYIMIGLFKIFNQILESNDRTSSVGEETEARSDTDGNTITTIYVEIFEVMVSLSATYTKTDLQIQQDGKNLAWQASTSMNSIILSLFIYWRHRSTVYSPKALSITNFMIFFVSLSFATEDEYMAGLDALFKSPNSIGCMIFFILVLSLKQ